MKDDDTKTLKNGVRLPLPLVLASVFGVFAVNFLILGYSIYLNLKAAKPVPTAAPQPAKTAAPSAPEPMLSVRYIAESVSLDPLAEFWGAAPELAVELGAQDVTAPMGGGTVPEVRIRAVHNGSEIAFRLEWDDETRDVENGVDTYKDAVALQFPVSPTAPPPSPLMGEAGKPVNIWQWRADWQQDSTDPNARLQRQPMMDDAFIPPGDQLVLKKQFPSSPVPGTPVVEFISEGWGTLTRQDRQDVQGGGRYENGKWMVVLRRSLVKTNPLDAEFAAGASGQFNVAVWDGSAFDVNGMKSVSLTWHQMQIEPAPPPPALTVYWFDTEPALNPLDEFWTGIDPIAVNLGSQDVNIPMGGGHIHQVFLRAAYNSENIAFHLEWSDTAPDMENGPDSFKDAVALQFPVSSAAGLPSPLMGDRGHPVNIWHWRADWQASLAGEDVRLGRQPANPGAVISESDDAVLKARYPYKPRPDTAMNEMISEGWGTLTILPDSRVKAAGEYRDGKWHVVMERPLGRLHPHETLFAAGGQTHLNVSVWEGGAGEVNGLKSVSKSWISVTLEPPRDAGEIHVSRLAQHIDLSPDHPVWSSVPEYYVTLVPQELTIPFGGGFVTRLKVQAAQSTDQLAFRLEWNDPTLDDENGVDTFKDAVAVQFPAKWSDPPPSPLMGEAGKPVTIWQWRSDWQHRALNGQANLARQPAWSSMQAPFSEWRTLPVSGQWETEAGMEAMAFVAEGWGTLTRLPETAVEARGEHREGRWSVVIVKPLNGDERPGFALSESQSSLINFAVWNGGAGDVNGAKSVRKNWTRLVFDAPQVN